MPAFVHEITSVFLEVATILQDMSTLTCNLCMTSMEELSGFVFLLLMELIGKMLQVTLFSYSLSFNEIGRIYVFFIGPSNQRLHTPSAKVMSSNVSQRSFEEWSLKPWAELKLEPCTGLWSLTQRVTLSKPARETSKGSCFRCLPQSSL